jgi:hypothetical protein
MLCVAAHANLSILAYLSYFSLSRGVLRCIIAHPLSEGPNNYRTSLRTDFGEKVCRYTPIYI